MPWYGERGSAHACHAACIASGSTPRLCMHRPSAIVVRLRSRPASTPLLALRSASDELHRLRLSGIDHCAACWCVLAVRARFGETNEIPNSDIGRSFCRVAGVLRMLGTHTGLSFESFTPTRVSIRQPPVSPRSGRAGAATHYLGMSTFIPKDSMSFSARLAACCISLGISCPRSFCRFGLIASEHSA